MKTLIRSDAKKKSIDKQTKRLIEKIFSCRKQRDKEIEGYHMNYK